MNKLIDAVKTGDVKSANGLLRHETGVVFPILGKLAVRNGDILMVKMLHSRRIHWPRDIFSCVSGDTGIDVLDFLLGVGCTVPDDLVDLAIETNNIDVLAFVHDHNLNVSPNAIRNAARLNRFTFIQFMRDVKIPWTLDAMESMILHGSVNMVKYALDNDCPRTLVDLCTAIESGRLEMVKLLSGVLKPEDINIPFVSEYASMNGTEEIKTFMNGFYSTL